MKKLLILMILFIATLSCTVDRMDVPTSSWIETVLVEPSAEYPNGGYWVYFLENDVIIESIFISNGANGKDGIDGINGIDGKDGVSATATVVAVEPSETHPWGGYNLTIGVGTDTETVFVSNGAAGLNGIDGIDGKDGKDGATVNVRTIESEGGTILVITYGNEETTVFIKDGQDGSNGINGTNGINGIDGKDGKDGVNGIDGVDGKDGVSSTIRTEQVQGGYNLYITVGTVTEVIFIANGTDGTNGLDGKDGLNGINGIDGKDGISSTIKVEETTGGYNLFIYQNQTLVETVFVRDGKDGADGQDGAVGAQGIQGIPGIDGKDGISSVITSRQAVGGYYLDITTNGVTTTIFIANGEDGQDGADGIDGINGKDGLNGTNGTNGLNGTSVTVRTDDFNGGYYLYITDANGTYTVTIYDGENGTSGAPGEPGEDGYNALFAISSTYECENGGIEITMGLDTNRNSVLDADEVDMENTMTLCNGIDGEPGAPGEPGGNTYITNIFNSDGTVCIEHETQNNETAEQFGTTYMGTLPNKNFILQLTLSEFVNHTYNYHPGSSSTGNHDHWYNCNTPN